MDIVDCANSLLDPNFKYKVLVVDDNKSNLHLLFGMLKDDYRVIPATNGFAALKIAKDSSPPDLIILDIDMPEMDGYEVCRQLKSDSLTCNIPVIFITALGDDHYHRKGLEYGAVDYIVKPVNPILTKARIKNHLCLKLYNDHLLSLVNDKTNKLALIQSVMMGCLGTLAEYRDPETGGHIKRTQSYVKAIAKVLQSHPDFSAELTNENIDYIYQAAPLHDVGKVAISDSILLKPGKLTDEEFKEMKGHAVLGFKALEKAALQLEREPFITYAQEISLTHHEKWDGSGYPKGISGDEIPISGRLMAVADVYDALISKRVYKKSFSHERAIAIIREGSGTHFDSRVVGAFFAIEPTIKNIALMYADFDEELLSLGVDVTAERLTNDKIDIGRKILVVDDHNVNLSIMEIQLKHLGFWVDCATNGEVALAMIAESDYDLVLTDLEMPVMNGYELVKEVNNLPGRARPLPVVAMTNSDFEMTKKRAIEFGFVDYMLKPLVIEQIELLVSKL